MPSSLYERVLGPDYALLPAAVRRLHALDGVSRWVGRADVTRGRHPLVPLVAWACGLPRSGADQELSVTFSADADGEIWDRSFGRHRFLSRQRPGPAGQILERLGPSELTLLPRGGPDGLSLTVGGMALLGVAMPAMLVPQIRTREWEEASHYRFDVEARLRGLGLLIAYHGWLAPAASAPGASMAVAARAGATCPPNPPSPRRNADR